MFFREPKKIIEEIRVLSEKSPMVQIAFYNSEDELYEIIESIRWLVEEKTKRKRRPTALLKHFIKVLETDGCSCKIVGFGKNE